MLPNAELYTLDSGTMSGVQTRSLVLPADPSRVAVIFWIAGSGTTVAIVPEGIPGTAQGIRMPTTGVLQFLWQQHGTIVQQAWYATMGISDGLAWQSVSYREK